MKINIINYLKKDNIPVPEYIKTITGEYNFIYENRVIIMQKFIYLVMMYQGGIQKKQLMRA